MTIQDTIQPLLKTLSYILLFIGFYLLLVRVDMYLKNKAIDDCGKISRFEETLSDKEAKVVYPISEVYNLCLEQKGIKK